MGRQLILSEEEKRNIQEMYGLINEQEESKFDFNLVDLKKVFEEILPLTYIDLDDGYDENPLKAGVDGVLEIHAGNYCSNKSGVEVTLYYTKDGNRVSNRICGYKLEDLKRKVLEVYNEIK